MKGIRRGNTWSRPSRRAALALAVAALAGGLACSAVSSLPFLPGTATPSPTATAAVQPGTQPLQIEGGPTINTRRDTRLAVTERLPVLEALAEEDYSNDELAEVGRTFTFTVALPGDLPVLWVYGWCTTTPEILEQNLGVMRMEFSVNGTVVDAQQFEPYEQLSDEAACRYFAAEVFAWPRGTTTLQTKVIFTEPLDDGFAEYEAGEQVFIYTVTVP
jgi:hypothetical protein